MMLSKQTSELAYQYLLQNNYAEAIEIYENLIESEHEDVSHVWYLGLAMLLDGRDSEAHLTWTLAVTEIEDIDSWIAGLVNVLRQEAQRRVDIEDLEKAFVIHQHICEIIPEDLQNLLQIVFLSIFLKTFVTEDLVTLGILDLLESETNLEIDNELLFNVWQAIWNYIEPDRLVIDFAANSLKYVRDCETGAEILRLGSLKFSYIPALARDMIELAVRLSPLDWTNVSSLAQLQQETGMYTEGIKNAKKLVEIAPDLVRKVLSSNVYLRGVLTAGAYWEEATEIYKIHLKLLSSLISENPVSIHPVLARSLFSVNFFFPYLQDNPKENRDLQNQIMQIGSANIQQAAEEQFNRYAQSAIQRKQNKLETSSRSLRIGYISFCMRQHSVGWLSRWLFEHHDRQNFQIYSYFIQYQDVGDPLQQWFAERSFKSYRSGIDMPEDGLAIAEVIHRDQLDILVDLDSLTNSCTCEVLAMKPAPVQVTWLGWDASSLSTIDYFIADPYVLPENAQEYYHEKIWRLPNTYIAVDGFEIDVPTLRREQLNIPSDAIIYLSAQKGYKRHSDTVKLQLQIIKSVPNSYFLIKGNADQDAIHDFFVQAAEEEGISSDRLRFLPNVGSESIHRANLGIADVVLDTYPYNGATTTLETLWMCIPLVTRVGEQFSARNSYTMMMNAGISEGIAWSDAEYVEWGVRLGKETALRQDISARLKASRQTSPLWNGEKFAREMENAYKQMWEIYMQSA